MLPLGCVPLKHEVLPVPLGHEAAVPVKLTLLTLELALETPLLGLELALSLGLGGSGVRAELQVVQVIQIPLALCLAPKVVVQAYLLDVIALLRREKLKAVHIVAVLAVGEELLAGAALAVKELSGLLPLRRGPLHPRLALLRLELLLRLEPVGASLLKHHRLLVGGDNPPVGKLKLGTPVLLALIRLRVKAHLRQLILLLRLLVAEEVAPCVGLVLEALRRVETRRETRHRALVPALRHPLGKGVLHVLPDALPLLPKKLKLEAVLVPLADSRHAGLHPRLALLRTEPLVALLPLERLRMAHLQKIRLLLRDLPKTLQLVYLLHRHLLKALRSLEVLKLDVALRLKLGKTLRLPSSLLNLAHRLVGALGYLAQALLPAKPLHRLLVLPVEVALRRRHPVPLVRDFLT